MTDSVALTDSGTASPGSRRPVRPRWYAALLTGHVVLAVGSVGVAGVLLLLAVTGLSSEDGDLVRGAYLALDVIAGTLFLPLAVLALATGVLVATTGGWGLTRHYWVLAKLVLTLGAATALIFSLRPALGRAAEAARSAPLSDLPGSGVGSVGTAATVATGIALVVLVLAASIGLAKPWGRIGRRR